MKRYQKMRGRKKQENKDQDKYNTLNKEICSDRKKTKTKWLDDQCSEIEN